MSALGNKQVMAENIQYYMNLYGKSRNDMCEALGIKYTTFTDWVKGKTYPRIDKIELMANYFGIKKSDLVEPHEHDPDSTDALRDRVFARAPALFKVLDKASDSEIHQIEKIANAIIDETNN